MQSILDVSRFSCFESPKTGQSLSEAKPEPKAHIYIFCIGVVRLSARTYKVTA